MPTGGDAAGALVSTGVGLVFSTGGFAASAGGAAAEDFGVVTAVSLRGVGSELAGFDAGSIFSFLGAG